MEERFRAVTVLADRLCGADANPIMRNAQEKRQLRKITEWLRRRRYRVARAGTRHNEMDPGTYALRLNIAAEQEGSGRTVIIPIDVAIMPKSAAKGDMPLLWSKQNLLAITPTSTRGGKKKQQKSTSYVPRTASPSSSCSFSVGILTRVTLDTKRLRASTGFGSTELMTLRNSGYENPFLEYQHD